MSKRNWFGERTVQQLPALRRYARTLAGEQQAEDLVHEALVRAYSAEERFREDGNLQAWLLRILHNAFVSGWRKDRTESAGIEHLGHHGATHTPPSQEDALHLQDLGRNLAQLSVEHRAVLHLIVAEGLSYEAAAQVLGVPAGTVMSRLSRARAGLRQAMADPPQKLRLVRRDT